MKKQEDSHVLRHSSGTRATPSRGRPAWLAPVLVIVAVAAFIPLAFLLGGKQPTQGPSQAVSTGQFDCRDLIAQAMEASGRSCDGTGANQACYGNTVVSAETLPDTSQRFSERGDIVDIDRLVRLSAAPLDLGRQVWGVAVLRILANLPRSLPGETVTMIVFGNTTLGSQASNLQSFYFFSEVGQIACAEVPYDGILITMPDGAGINLMVNGAELTLMGKASLSAERNGRMNLNLYEGSAQIGSDGQVQDLRPGEQVSIDLGGPDGTDAIGPPSDPEPIDPEDTAILCTITGQNCLPTETPPAGDSEASATAKATLRPVSTAIRTPSKTATSLLTPAVTPTFSRTPEYTATDLPPESSPTLTPSKAPLPIKTPTDTLIPTVPSPTQPAPAPVIQPSATPLPTLTAVPVESFVVLGLEGVWLEQNCVVNSGSIGANVSSIGPYLTGSQEVVIGSGVSMLLSSSQVIGDSIQIQTDAAVYDVAYNDIVQTGTVNGLHFSPLTLPVISNLPAVPEFTAGSLSYSLPAGDSLTLDAGDYGQLDTKAQATVTFTGGVYNFSGWTIGQNSNLYFLAPTEIRIAGNLDTGAGTYLGPADSSGLSAADILIIVTGINGTTGTLSATPKALQIGSSNTLIANLYAPNGTLWLRQLTIATGAFLGRWVDIDPGIDLTLESAFH